MRIGRLRLQNFRQHRDTTVEFGPGITGIIGGLACAPTVGLLMRFLANTFPVAMAALPDTVRTMVPIIVREGLEAWRGEHD